MNILEKFKLSGLEVIAGWMKDDFLPALLEADKAGISLTDKETLLSFFEEHGYEKQHMYLKENASELEEMKKVVDEEKLRIQQLSTITETPTSEPATAPATRTANQINNPLTQSVPVASEAKEDDEEDETEATRDDQEYTFPESHTDPEVFLTCPECLDEFNKFRNSPKRSLAEKDIEIEEAVSKLSDEEITESLALDIKRIPRRKTRPVKAQYNPIDVLEEALPQTQEQFLIRLERKLNVMQKPEVIQHLLNFVKLSLKDKPMLLQKYAIYFKTL